MPTCYLGLGSNLKSPRRQLNQALQAIQRIPNILIKNTSSLYYNPPMGVKSQPMFYNLVTEIQTNLPAQRLLQELKAIEVQQSRITKRRWGARTIDIDILLYGDRKINQHDLQVPHPGVFIRDFVRIPLNEIAPNLVDLNK